MSVVIMIGVSALLVVPVALGTRRILRGRRRRTQWIAWAVVGGVLAIAVVNVTLFVTVFSGPGLLADSAPTLMQRSTSPDGRWTVRVWDDNPGAMASESWSADLIDNSHQRSTRRVFELIDSGDATWTDGGRRLAVRWVSDSVVSIGGHKIVVPTGYWGDAGVDYTNATFHFGISYDPNSASAGVDKDASSVRGWEIPGVGHVSGASLVYVVHVPASPGNGSGGVVEVTAVKDPQLKPPTLQEFAREPYLHRLEAHDWIGDPPRAVTLDGTSAYSVTGQFTGGPFKGLTIVDYVIYGHGFLYYLKLAGRTRDWGAEAPTLEDVAESFRLM
jgi:hypothetical protein